jgi:hypothetical protein
MRPLGAVRSAAAMALVPLIAGCYTYVPMMTPEPAPGARLSLVLTDQGRLDAARQIGPYTLKVEGALVERTEIDYVMQVSDVVDIRGARSKWAGETVPLRRSYVATTYQRRLSRGRTAFLIAGLASAFIGGVLGFDILGFATGNDGGWPPPPDPNGQ